MANLTFPPKTDNTTHHILIDTFAPYIDKYSSTHLSQTHIPDFFVNLQVDELKKQMRMNRPLYITIAILSLLSAACSNPDAGQPRSLMDASRHELAEALNERDSLLTLMSDILYETNKIKHLEHILATDNLRGKNAQRTNILADIAAIKDTLHNRRLRLNTLESKLKKSDFFNIELKHTIDAINNEIDSRTNEIERLQTLLSQANRHIGKLNSTVNDLNGSMLSATQELKESQHIASQLKNELKSTKSSAANIIAELNSCYYAIGKKSELKKHQILETGFLRKNKILESNFDHEFFTKADKRNLRTINLPHNKARILTNHPAGSFEITEQGNRKTIHILSPDSFWQTSNYLVIQTD